MTKLVKIELGWVPLDEEGKPYQPMRGKYYHLRKKPVTLYKTEGRAKGYSPVKKARPVFYEVEIPLDNG